MSGKVDDIVRDVENEAKYGEPGALDELIRDLKKKHAQSGGNGIAAGVAGACFSPDGLQRLRERLVDESKFPAATVERAIAADTLGWKTANGADSDMDADTRQLHGMACIVRNRDSGDVKAVDVFQSAKQSNGGIRGHCIGERLGAAWVADPARAEQAHTVVIVDDPIDALTLEGADLRGHAALALRAEENAEAIDFRFLAGKRVLICLHDGVPTPGQGGYSTSQKSAWQLHEALLALDIAAFMVDQAEWEDADLLTLHDIFLSAGADGVKEAIRKLEPWIIPGQPGKFREGRHSRVYLPPRDVMEYFKFRAAEDFVSVRRETIDKETGETKESSQDVCGFRVAGLSRVSIAGFTATMTGEIDAQPETIFSVSVQAPRHGLRLVRRVFEDGKLYDLGRWEKFGALLNPLSFKRMLTLLERTAGFGARDAINFVGLAWRDGKLTVNQGPECYFKDPDKQCPYHNLQFPSGSRRDARLVIEAYQATFERNAGLQLLVWALGAHLKAFLGFWPHIILQADKGAGKTVLCKRLERTIAYTMFSSETIKSSFRLLGSVSYTSHPVGWEEVSTLTPKQISAAVECLQQNYQYAHTTRGAEKLPYLLTAPVLLAGEDVPMHSLLGKVVRVELTGRKGALMAEDLPKFPVLEWLHYLAGFTRAQIQEQYELLKDSARERSRATRDDDGATRMTDNYAAIMLAWKLLADFADIPWQQGDLITDCIATMNDHIAETDGDRQPWVWIMDILLSEIDRGEFRHPYLFDTVDVGHRSGLEALIIRPSHIMDHIAHSPSLRDRWNALPIKTHRVFKRQLNQAGVILTDEIDRTIGNRRMQHLTALDIEKLAQYGLHASPTERRY